MNRLAMMWDRGEPIVTPQVDIKHNQTKTYVLTKHSNNIKHQICIYNSHIIVKIDHYFHRKIREALEINKHPNNLNRDKGGNISEHWIPTLTSKILPSQTTQ